MLRAGHRRCAKPRDRRPDRPTAVPLLGVGGPFGATQGKVRDRLLLKNASPSAARQKRNRPRAERAPEPLGIGPPGRSRPFASDPDVRVGAARRAPAPAGRPPPAPCGATPRTPPVAATPRTADPTSSFGVPNRPASMTDRSAMRSKNGPPGAPIDPNACWKSAGVILACPDRLRTSPTVTPSCRASCPRIGDVADAVKPGPNAADGAFARTVPAEQAIRSRPPGTPPGGT